MAVGVLVMLPSRFCMPTRRISLSARRPLTMGSRTTFDIIIDAYRIELHRAAPARVVRHVAVRLRIGAARRRAGLVLSARLGGPAPISPALPSRSAMLVGMVMR